ncbi:MAG TPA: DUF488 family protein [Solirubrobacteraceae bacterium]|nr:DUF488 family protein [Solirubrobacteraceae bacterium]
MTIDVRIKRAYDEPDEEQDGHRVLVDRLWPRGVARDRLRIDAWERDLAPSKELRAWFGHDPARFAEFRRRYVAELQEHAAALAALRRIAKRERVTLVYAAADREHNNAVVIAEVLRGDPLRRRGAPSRDESG